MSLSQILKVLVAEANLTEDADKPEPCGSFETLPEFLNRFNAVIEFSHLSKGSLSKIVDLMLIDVKTLSKKEPIQQWAMRLKNIWQKKVIMVPRPPVGSLEQIRDKVARWLPLDNLMPNILKPIWRWSVVIKENEAQKNNWNI